MSTKTATSKYIATAFGLCSSTGATAEEARAKVERKAKKFMREMKASGPLPRITVRQA